MCTKSKQKRTGARGTHAGFPNVMMKPARKDIDIARLVSTTNFARLAFKPNVENLSSTDPSIERKFSKDRAEEKAVATRRGADEESSREPEIVQFNYRRTTEFHG